MADLRFYPKWIEDPKRPGVQMKVLSPLHHSQIIGKPVTDEGEVIEEDPVPPIVDDEPVVTELTQAVPEPEMPFDLSTISRAK